MCLFSVSKTSDAQGFKFFLSEYISVKPKVRYTWSPSAATGGVLRLSAHLPGRERQPVLWPCCPWLIQSAGDMQVLGYRNSRSSRQGCCTHISVSSLTEKTLPFWQKGHTVGYRSQQEGRNPPDGRNEELQQQSSTYVHRCHGSFSQNKYLGLFLSK